MLGIFNDFKPRFVKHFAELAPQISAAFEAYANEVKARTFPGIEHTFQVKQGSTINSCTRPAPTDRSLHGSGLASAAIRPAFDQKFGSLHQSY